MDLDLQDAVVIVTGGSKGLGKACAKAFLQEGAKVALVARGQAGLDVAVHELQTWGSGRVSAIAADLSQPHVAQQVVQQVTQQWGRVEVLVNSAGAAKRTPVEALDWASWNAGLQAKFTPYVNMLDAVLPGMVAAAQSGQAGRLGAVVNVVGVGGKIPSASHLPGGAANAGLLLATVGLGRHYAQYGIRINAVNPGHIATDRLPQAIAQEASRQSISHAEAQAALQAQTPMQRFGTPEEVAHAVVFLASARASYTTGSFLSVDGGYKAVV
ncbi:SDR family oxidoreductase [Lampropedia puyangensis]|uniref:SDR family oxidoreductase n=1 Tax=Lampropedia puyangensis TaxID=1330072 RepID=A0A4S8EUW7_9BURK|nr:SDR family oxidoreductase [Lampropedia puyangensis]THT98090.1 SDR family oxidoreductase [Lampropedia puyangensis]